MTTLEQNFEHRAIRVWPWLYQLVILTRRSLLIQLQLLEGIISALVMGVFFLLIYDAAFSGSAEHLPGLQDTDYLAFTLPIAIISAALSSPAGQSMVRDIESGYFDKLLLTPANRAALVLAHIISGGVALVLQTSILILVALILGVSSATGAAGLLVNIGIALFLGVGFSGLSVGVALRTSSAAATQSAGFLFFPLMFLTTTFVPLDLLSGWLKLTATINPITYILDAMRSVLITGWDAPTMLQGLAASAAISVLPFVFAFASLKTRTSRQ